MQLRPHASAWLAFPSSRGKQRKHVAGPSDVSAMGPVCMSDRQRPHRRAMASQGGCHPLELSGPLDSASACRLAKYRSPPPSHKSVRRVPMEPVRMSD
eukprot:15447265-Alexandrium_andersonii.AAC.1